MKEGLCGFQLLLTAQCPTRSDRSVNGTLTAPWLRALLWNGISNPASPTDQLAALSNLLDSDLLFPALDKGIIALTSWGRRKASHPEALAMVLSAQ